MTDYSTPETPSDDYLDPQFHEVDPREVVLNDNLEIDDLSDDAALDDLALLDGVPDQDSASDSDSESDANESPSEMPSAQGSLFAASTGDPRVDGAVSRLNDLATSDITEHPAVLEDVHRRLHNALADLDR
jgi:hypothetical protein